MEWLYNANSQYPHLIPLPHIYTHIHTYHTTTYTHQTSVTTKSHCYLLTFRSLWNKRAVRQPVEILGYFRCSDEQVLRWQTKNFHHLHHLIKLHTTFNSCTKHTRAALPLLQLHTSIVSKQLNVESCKQRHMIIQGLCSFLMPKI